MGGSALTFQGEHDGYWGDVQWHTGTAYESASFWSGNSYGYRVNLRYVTSVGNAVEGQSLARNGKTTTRNTTVSIS